MSLKLEIQKVAEARHDITGHSGGTATDSHRLPLAHGFVRIEYGAAGVKILTSVERGKVQGSRFKGKHIMYSVLCIMYL